MIARLKEEDCRFIFLEVRASNGEAKKIYESLGFTTLGVRKSYYSSPVEDAVVMVLKLPG
jgi:ribosomal-protein-alanine N-acetyltransferase